MSTSRARIVRRGALAAGQAACLCLARTLLYTLAVGGARPASPAGTRGGENAPAGAHPQPNKASGRLRHRRLCCHCGGCGWRCTVHTARGCRRRTRPRCSAGRGKQGCWECFPARCQQKWTREYFSHHQVRNALQTQIPGNGCQLLKPPLALMHQRNTSCRDLCSCTCPCATPGVPRIPCLCSQTQQQTTHFCSPPPHIQHFAVHRRHVGAKQQDAAGVGGGVVVADADPLQCDHGRALCAEATAGEPRASWQGSVGSMGA